MVNFSTQLLSLLAVVAIVAAAPTTPANNILKARDVTCRDDLPEDTIGRTTDAVECINFLANLGISSCTGSVSAAVFCRRGETQITGITASGEQTATCQQVAQAAGRILDLCSRGDGSVRGANEAIGNPALLVDIRRVV